MKTICYTLLFLFFYTNHSIAQEVVIKGILRCMIYNNENQTKGAENIIIIPSFNPKESVASTTTPKGYFQINTGWEASKLIDKEVALYIITKCASCKKIQRIFVTEDLDKKNTDPNKVYITVKNWKVLNKCQETELQDLLASKMLDSARNLPPENISGSSVAGAATSPVSFLNVFEKLVKIATQVNGGTFEVGEIKPGKINFGNLLLSSPLINSDNIGFNFSPNRNISEAVFWNPSAIAINRIKNNISFNSNFKNNYKLSGFAQISNNFYIGIGGIYIRQNQLRPVFYKNLFTVAHSDKLNEFASFITPIYKVNNSFGVSVSLKSIWQSFNNPNKIKVESDGKGGGVYTFMDDSTKKINFDMDLAASYKANNNIQLGLSVMNIINTKLYNDMFLKGKETYINQISLGLGACYKHERINIGLDGLFTTKGLYDASIGLNYVPKNNILLAGGYTIKQNSFAVSVKIKHFKMSYINDNDYLINNTKKPKNKFFNGYLYSGFSFNI